MISLTQSAIVSRKVIRYSIYLIILVVIGRLMYNGGIVLYDRLFPEPPPPPTVTFGTLSKIPFPEKEVPNDISYILETVDGNLPEFATQLNVYFMPKSTSNIRVLEEGRDKARKLKFNPLGKELVETVYVFEKDKEPSSLTLNIVTDIFSVSYDINSNPSVVSGIPIDSEPAIAATKAFLSPAGFMQPDLNGPATTKFLQITKGEFQEVSSLSEADLIKVNLFRANTVINEVEYPSVTPDFDEANVWFILSGTGTIIAGEYHYYPILEEQLSTYPIKTAQEAWEELKAGGGYVANLGNNEGNIVIRNVYMAYYDAGQYTEHYQPVVVFEGDGGFAAYVPAVTSEFYPGDNPTPTQE